MATAYSCALYGLCESSVCGCGFISLLSRLPRLSGRLRLRLRLRLLSSSSGGGERKGATLDRGRLLIVRGSIVPFVETVCDGTDGVDVVLGQ